MIDAYSAISARKDAFDAGREAAETAMGGLTGPPDMIWAFGAISYDQRRLLDGIRSVLGTTPLVGCTTDGEISTSGLSLESLVVLALRSDHLRFATVSVGPLSGGSFAAGVKAGEELERTRCRYLQIFSDGLTGNATEIIQGIQHVLGRDINIAGGTAGDGGLFARTFQYHNDQLLTDSLVAVAFEGDFHFGTGVRSGWMPFGIAKQVTKSVGNVVYELDGQPALEVYERFLGRYASQLPAVGVEYPLGLLGPQGNVEEDGFFLCRATMGVDREKGSIIFAGDVPEGSLVKMTMGNEQDVIEAARQAAKDALVALRRDRESVLPKALFIYSCMARKIVLGSRTGEEVQRVQKVIGENIPIIGFYTYGEYAPVGKRGLSCFHNETITLTVVGEE